MLRTVIAFLAVFGVSIAGIAADVTYRKDIKPLFEQKCAACHGAGSPYLGDFNAAPDKYKSAMKGPRMDTYADLIMYVGWPDTGAIMRRLDDGKNTGDGKPGNMHAFLGATDEERQKNLDLFKQWVGKDGWKLNRWKARGKVPAITKEELDKMEVKY